MSLFLLVLLGPLLPFWVLLKLRVVPDKLMQLWFGLLLAAGFIWLYLVCAPVYYVAHRMAGLVSRNGVHRYSIIMARIMLRTVRFLNPQCRVWRDYSRLRWENIPRNAHVIFNHTSFWDSLHYTAEAPTFAHNKKTLMKSSLRSMPIAGAVMFDFIGSFPVFFTKDEGDNFGVDKEKQAAVQREVDQWCAGGEGLGFCPEGRMSPDPNTILPLRFGSMKMLADSGNPIYVCTQLNNTTFWRLGEQIGGHAADLAVTLAEYKYKGGKEPMPRDAQGALDVAAICEDCRTFMQSELDRLKAEHKKALAKM